MKLVAQNATFHSASLSMQLMVVMVLKVPPIQKMATYWDELRVVIQERAARLNNVPVDQVLPWVPRVWSGYTLEDVADAVHNEYPGANQAALIEHFIGLGIPINRTVIPADTKVHFLRYEILLAEINTWAIGMVGPHNFGLKWYGGRARPEEIAWHITRASGAQLAAWGVPTDIVASILQMNLLDQRDFTAYDEGSPTHPSWPAIHSAASVASFWLSIIMDLSFAELCEAQAIDYGVAYGRTIAGVHFPTGNTAGLNLGQELLARKLPDFLEERRDATPDIVRARIAEERHDWTFFATGACSSL